MNNLSWLIYWADILPSVSRLIAALGFMFSIVGVGFIIARLITKHDAILVKKYDDAVALWEEKGSADWKSKPDIYDFNVRSDTRSGAATFEVVKNGWIILPFALTAWAASFFVPEKDTFYMIAASEAGEEVAKTPEVAKIRTIINNWLDKTVNETTKEKTSE